MSQPLGISVEAAPEHSGDAALSAEILDPTAALRIAAAWRDLAGRALEPNVFFGPEIALPGMSHLPEGGGSCLVAVWRGSGPDRRLVGALPVVRPRRRHLNPFPVRRAAEFYGTLSTPLIAPERARDTLRLMLRALAGAGQAGLLLPFLHADGPVAAALGELCDADGFLRVVLGSHHRAILRSPLPGAEYIRATLETRRRKEADRQRRRLSDEGELRFHVARGEAEVARDLEAFLSLEAVSWKGELGTDLTSAPGAAAFIREASRALAERASFRVGTLSLDGRVIAAGLVAQHGTRAFYLKTTYDEAFARFSPGLLLTLDLTAHLLDDPSVADADSIAIADHPMIDRVWTERFPVACVMVSTRPGGGAAFRAAVAAERWREALVARLKVIRVKFYELRKPRIKVNSKKNSGEAPV
jgi:CelD/BcsL family acetyltransferase involved in cellulose biosynthesis